MAMVAKVLMVVLAFGCATVMNQSTTRDHDDKSLIRILPHLEMLITKLEGKMMLEMAGLEQQLISRFRQLRNMTEFRGVGKYNICSLIGRIAPPARKGNFEGEKRADQGHMPGHFRGRYTHLDVETIKFFLTCLMTSFLFMGSQ